MLEIINSIVLIIGIPTIVVALVFVGRKLQILDDLQTTTNKVKTNLKIVCDYLIGDEGFNHGELQAYSPLQLTDEGKKLVVDMGFDSIFEKHKDDFFAFIENEHPTHKHDVELAAIKTIYTLQDKEYMGFLKTFFYNNPKRNLPNTAPTLGVYVRDAYLAEHPGIKE